MKAYTKLTFRGIRKSLNRFLSILAIVALGVGFLAGLFATTPDMKHSVDVFYDKYAVLDLDIKGSMGLTEEDIAALSELDYIETVMPLYSTDILMNVGEGESLAVRFFGVPTEKFGTESYLNGVELTEGRLPENPGECIIETGGTFAKENIGLGTKITLSEENKNSDKLSDTYASNEYTVVGIAAGPYYFSVESEVSTVGSGKVALFVYAPAESYALEVYTDMFVTLKGAKDMNCFDSEYEKYVEDAADKLEEFGKVRSEIRYQDIVNEATAELDEARAEYDTAKADADKELAEAAQKITDAEKELADGQTEIDISREKLADEREYLLSMQAYMPQKQFDAAAAELDGAEQEIIAAEAELADGRAELDKAKTKYEQAKADAEKELADAESKLNDAEKEIAQIEQPEWYISDRSSNMGYTSFKSNAEKVDAIAKVFPVVFFLVAALVCLTTMTRMVEEERTQIGTLKALGYSKIKIMMYYVAYCGTAGILGSAVGLLIGFNVLPAVIWNAYGMMYALPPLYKPFIWYIALPASLAAILCAETATISACRHELAEKPARLMIPKAPKAGKRVFLERIGFIWKRLKFTHKVTLRNLIRYKKRFFMTVIGVAGCTALLVTGFGLRDSIGDIIYKQFGEVYKYDLSINLREDEADSDLTAVLDDGEAIEQWAYFHEESGHAEKENVTICVPKNTEDLKKFLTLRDRRTHSDVAFDGTGAVITEKLAETLGVKKGDAIIVKNADGKSGETVVSGITENYVLAYVYLSEEEYEGVFGTVAEPNKILATTAEGSDGEKTAAKILESESAGYVQFNDTIRDTFDNLLSNIDYIVIVLIISAAALAMIVLYNLTNINVCERKKELATIKVLGFYDGEVSAYIYRETGILSTIGTLLGLVLGIFLHAFVVRTAEVDAVMFGREISALSYVLAAAITLFFSVLVNLILHRKLKDISMVESMKAND